eukprot:13971652-Alexandrium_andersonii.AAC.1
MASARRRPALRPASGQRSAGVSLTAPLVRQGQHFAESAGALADLAGLGVVVRTLSEFRVERVSCCARAPSSWDPHKWSLT